ncbi:MAG: Crp/Fnr family transcriptional regulator [Solirubrobacterales bacterium]|nr:Crp/Fnr family transcriptional regulator [Solirubrobacterales bacterium]MBV9716798.1 Crp/Fnr family transcriptional regulator [Solirubrobacterales bacterium]
MSVDPGSHALCHVLREDPELADAIPAERRQRAIEECLAPVRSLPTGGWQPPAATEGVGLLVLGGLIIRRVGIEGRHGAELLGQGDVLRPWQREPESLTPLKVTTGWSIVDRARIALLDDDFVAFLGRYPEVAGCLVGRALQRARNLVVNIAIVHQARVDVRLHMLLWHLAARWGRVRSDGTALPLRLTHTVLADLVAARRPTVTSALSDLSRRGLVRLVDDTWLLVGDPPWELLELASS